MQEKLIVPEDVVVGFQKRSDTYSGLLAFITYRDKDGKTKQKNSWERWRNQQIQAAIFDNEPTSGFVLNKKVGGGGGWSRRDTWARIYDPRGFEFEISISNLFFILQECSSIKGKGLEGEFVYAWDRQKVILLPTSCPEYQASQEHTRLQYSELTEEDMEAGCLYRNKEGKELIYLGRERYYYLHSKFCYKTWKTLPPKQRYTNKHIFVALDGEQYGFAGTTSPYWVQPDFKHLADRLTQDPVPEFAAKYDAFKSSQWGKKPEKQQV